MRLSKNGLVTDGEGWFVVNARDSRWRDEGPLGSYCTFEGKRRFPHFGINISNSSGGSCRSASINSTRSPRDAASPAVAAN